MNSSLSWPSQRSRIIKVLTTIVLILSAVEMSGHQPRVFFTLNKFIRGTLSDNVHLHGDFVPRGILHKSMIKNPLKILSINLLCRQYLLQRLISSGAEHSY